MDPKEIRHLVDVFADSVVQQTETVGREDARAGNRHAKRYTAAFRKLRTVGDSGRDALVLLFSHPRGDVRVTAASCLLRHRTKEALDVLQKKPLDLLGSLRFVRHNQSRDGRRARGVWIQSRSNARESAYERHEGNLDEMP